VQALEGSRLLASRRGQARCSGSHCVHSEQLLSSSHQLLNVSRSTVQLTTCTRACRGFCKPGFAFQPSTEVAEVDIVRHAGVDLLHDPLHNKVYPAHTLAYALCDAGEAALGSRAGRCAQGTAFPASERERLQLRGLLPPRILKMDAQVLPGPNAPVCAGASRHCRGLTLPLGVGPTDRALYGRLHLRQDLPRPGTREGGRRDARARARPLLAHLCCLLWEWCTLSGSALIALDCRCGAGRRSRSCRCNPPVSASRCQ